MDPIDFLNACSPEKKKRVTLYKVSLLHTLHVLTIIIIINYA